MVLTFLHSFFFLIKFFFFLLHHHWCHQFRHNVFMSICPSVNPGLIQNWLELGCQRSSSLWPHKTHFGHCSRIHTVISLKTDTLTLWYSTENVVFVIQLHSSGTAALLVSRRIQLWRGSSSVSFWCLLSGSDFKLFFTASLLQGLTDPCSIPRTLQTQLQLGPHLLWFAFASQNSTNSVKTVFYSTLLVLIKWL